MGERVEGHTQSNVQQTLVALTAETRLGLKSGLRREDLGAPLMTGTEEARCWERKEFCHRHTEANNGS